MSDRAAVRQANQALWKSHPELHGRQLTTAPEDEAYRQEWRAQYRKALEKQKAALDGLKKEETVQPPAFSWNPVSASSPCTVPPFTPSKKKWDCEQAKNELIGRAKKKLTELREQQAAQKKLEAKAAEDLAKRFTDYRVLKTDALQVGVNVAIVDPAQQLAAAITRADLYDRATEYAKLSRAVYCLGTPPGYVLKRQWDDSDSSFRAALYYSKLDGRYVLAFAGTEMNSAADWTNNYQQAASFSAKQYEMAKSVSREVYPTYGSNLTITGHSLGGGLAATGSLETNSPAYTFNGAGVNPDQLVGGTERKELAATRLVDNSALVHNFKVDGEILSTVQDSNILDVAVWIARHFPGPWLLPAHMFLPKEAWNAAGSQHSLKAGPCSGPSESVDRHLMKRVLPLMVEQKYRNRDDVRTLLGEKKGTKDGECRAQDLEDPCPPPVQVPSSSLPSALTYQHGF